MIVFGLIGHSGIYNWIVFGKRKDPKMDDEGMIIDD